MPEKLNAKILRYALQELDQHLLPDLLYTSELRRFLKREIKPKHFLDSEYGFKRFLYVYGISRTIGAGDECKLKILSLIRKYPFDDHYIATVTSLAEKIQKQSLSSNAAKGGYSLPRSFCSKLLYVYKPDEIIPFDSYVLQSLEIYYRQKIKSIQQYYQLADEFRNSHFSENSDAIKNLHEKYDALHLDKMTSLEVNPGKLYSWKLTDKYLWCEAELRK